MRREQQRPVGTSRGGRWLGRTARLGARFFRGGFGGDVVEAAGGPAEERIDVGEVTLVALRWPDGDGGRPAGLPLVLLHGLNDSAWSWARAAGALALERPVHALSLRGHGGSSRPATGYAIGDAARDVRRALALLAPDGAALGGHSWGGKVALQVAAEAPDRVRALVLADPVLPGGFNPVLRRFPGLVEASFSPERQVWPDRDTLLAAGRERVYLQRGDDLDRRVWLGKHEERPDGSWGPWLPESAFRDIVRALEEDQTDLLPRVRCPTLLLRPTFTVSFWPRELAGLRRGVADLRERRVSGDHSFVHSNAVDTARQIATFLEGVPGR